LTGYGTRSLGDTAFRKGGLALSHGMFMMRINYLAAIVTGEFVTVAGHFAEPAAIPEVDVYSGAVAITDHLLRWLCEA
jgi:hypothetical protein